MNLKRWCIKQRKKYVYIRLYRHFARHTKLEIWISSTASDGGSLSPSNSRITYCFNQQFKFRCRKCRMTNAVVSGATFLAVVRKHLAPQLLFMRKIRASHNQLWMKLGKKIQWQHHLHGCHFRQRDFYYANVCRSVLHNLSKELTTFDIWISQIRWSCRWIFMRTSMSRWVYLSAHNRTRSPLF